MISIEEPVFRRLEHFKVHEYALQFQLSASAAGQGSRSTDSASPSDVKRKRGRPPKYQVLDVNVNPITSASQSPDYMLTSFKLPRNGQPTQTPRRGRPRTVSSPRDPGPSSPDHSMDAILRKSSPEPQHRPTFDGFTTYMPSEVCTDPTCKNHMQMHFHCTTPRCYYSTNKSELLEIHTQV